MTHRHRNRLQQEKCSFVISYHVASENNRHFMDQNTIQTKINKSET